MSSTTAEMTNQLTMAKKGRLKTREWKRESVKNARVENAGVEFMAPEYRDGKRERSDYGKPKFT